MFLKIKYTNIRRNIIKERFFTVIVQIVLVAFAVFPMRLEADPGSHENQYEMNNLNSDAQFFNKIPTRKPVYIPLTSRCKEHQQF